MISDIGIVLIIFTIMLFVGVPLAFTMSASAIIGFALSSNLDNLTFSVRILSALDSFALLAIPLFLLAGEIMSETGITSRILNFANALLGHFTGGLGYGVTFTGVVMAGISGSANADAAAIGAIMVPAMTENGYGEGYAVSLVATAGVLGPIIPPSIMMIIYATCTGLPISALFAAGIIPGTIIAGGMCVYNYIYAKKVNVGLCSRAGTAIFELKTLCDNDCVDIIQPDACQAGGIGVVKRAADYAAFSGKQIAPHVFRSGISLSAHLHILSTCTNVLFCEHQQVANPLLTELLVDPIEYKDGYFTVPDSPGLGVFINDEIINKYPFLPGTEQRFKVESL